MRVSATAKYIRHSTRKTRLVTQAIVGLPVERGQRDPAVHAPGRGARTSPRCSRAPRPTPRTTTTCHADDLVVVEAIADEGPTHQAHSGRAPRAARSQSTSR